MADIVHGARFAGKRKTRQNRFVFIFLAAALVIFFGQCIFRFVLAPNMRIDSIIVENNAPLSRDELLSAAGLRGQSYYFRIDVEAVKAKLEALPAVKTAIVRKIFPGSLRIITQSRQPVALSFAESSAGSLPVAFDEEGVVFLSGNEVPETGLPVLSGIRFSGFRPGLRLPEMLRPFLTDIMKLGKSSPAVLSAFSEMKIVRKASEQFEYILYPVYHRVPVRMEGELTAVRCKTVLIVLDTLAKENILDRVEEIDFRTEDIIYRMKEG